MEPPSGGQHANQDAIFDGIMETVGNNGAFQRRFKYIFNIALVICVSMLYMNIVLAMSVPEHWCHVPGREQTNMSEDAWKNLTLPRTLDNRGMETYNSCHMYDVDLELLLEYSRNTKGNYSFPHSNVTTTCKYGYEYDRTYYELTAVSQQDWVCDKELHVTNTFVFNRLGEVVGTLILGQLGDYLGRRLTFYFSALMGVLGSVLIMTTSHSFLLFSISAVMSALTLLSLFQAPLIISMETSDPESRGRIAMWQCIGWTVGLCALPMIFWMIRDWVWFMAVTSFPTLIFLCFPYYMIESPRWLANRKRFAKCAEMLNRIAKVNGKEVQYSEQSLQQIFASVKEEKVYGIISLFSHWRLFWNTILLIAGRTITNIAYLTIMLNCSRMKDPFMSFFWQSLIELPAFVLGQYWADKIGRRLTNSASFIGAAVLCVPVILLAKEPEFDSFVVWGVIAIKFFVSINFFISNLQAMEMYPTCLRQTGVSVGSISANTIGMLGPYIVLLGTNYDARYPYMILMAVFIVGAFVMLFLPETLHQKLPESLREAELFGKDQKFWNIPKAGSTSTEEVVDDKEMHILLEKLNK